MKKSNLVTKILVPAIPNVGVKAQHGNFNHCFKQEDEVEDEVHVGIELDTAFGHVVLFETHNHDIENDEKHDHNIEDGVSDPFG